MEQRETGSKDALYDELRRRLVRSQRRDVVDRYQDTLRRVRERLDRTGEHVSSLLASRTSVWIAGGLTVVFAAVALFLALGAAPNPALADLESAPPEAASTLEER